LVKPGLIAASGTIELVLVSILRPELKKEWPDATEVQLSLISSVTFLGEMVGGVIWGYIGDKYGSIR
jgi:MFS family permease